MEKKKDGKKVNQVKKEKETKVSKTSVKKTSSEKKVKGEGIFKKIGKYFKGVSKEVKRIRWTSLSDLLKYSIATLVFVLFLGLYFYGIDWLVLLIRSLVK